MQQKINQAVAVLRQAVRDFSPVCFANSLGAEDMVLTDIIARGRLDISMFSLDTGRLPQETYDLMQEVRKHYAVRLQVYFPDSALVEEYVAMRGINGFYDSVEARKGCCHVRKVEPLRRALAGKGAWVTGMRRDQAVTRGTLEVSVFRCGQRPAEVQPAAGLVAQGRVGIHPPPRRALQQAARPVLSQPGLRAMHPLRHAGGRYPLRAMVVGGPEEQGVRPACQPYSANSARVRGCGED